MTGHDSVQIYRSIPINMLYPFPTHRPEQDIDEDYWLLFDSIRKYGVFEPIHVFLRWEDGMEKPDGFYIIDGHRRVRACDQLGASQIPAYIHAIDMSEADDLAYMLNLRMERTPEEKAAALKMLEEAEERIRYKQAEKDKAEWDRKRAELAGMKERDNEK